MSVTNYCLYLLVDMCYVKETLVQIFQFWATVELYKNNAAGIRDLKWKVFVAAMNYLDKQNLVVVIEYVVYYRTSANNIVWNIELDNSNSEQYLVNVWSFIKPSHLLWVVAGND